MERFAWYLGGPNTITRVLTNERERQESQRRCDHGSRGQSDTAAEGAGSSAMRAGKGKEGILH